jgi:rubredoxin
MTRPVSPHPQARPRREFRCEGCGYGALAAIAPERCPMCGGSTWTLVPLREKRQSASVHQGCR